MLKQLLEKLLCKHIWEEKYVFSGYKSNIKKDGEIPKSVTIILTCQHCGKIKKIEI